MSQDSENSRFKGILGWIDYRLPIVSYFVDHYVFFKAPKNLNYLWNMGSIAGIVLVIQILTGLFLAMHYNPSAEGAFASVEHIMRDVNFGWLIRYAHSNGASMFFVVLYLHIFRGFYYGSYKAPRELLWILGVIIFLVVMATAFMGYVLPWGQMSYWGATVITNLFSAIPLVGDSIVSWIWGGFTVDNPTLNRFFVLHYLLPFILCAIVFLHLTSLHTFGSNNPTGVSIKDKKDTVPFHPYYTAKDSFGFAIFFIVYFVFVFFAPNYLGHPDNYIEADSLVTPSHIVPEWYFLPFYAILRAIPNKLGGVIAMIAAIVVWVFLPILDRSKIRSGNYRPTFCIFYIIFALNFLFLMWLGGQEAKEPFLSLSRLSLVYYFAYFLIILPILPKFEKTLELPNSVSDSMKRC
ncbi:cytochrome b/b6 [Anaplasmataceae bacterium AB001_6]|nr:cytochrome b/b6 [Anaplasmataceae bacterium AB001_6]